MYFPTLIITVLLVNPLFADIRNECDQISPHADVNLNSIFEDFAALPLYSSSEHRVDLDKKLEENKFKTEIINQSQVIEAERFFFVKNKKLRHKPTAYENFKVIAVVAYSNFKSKRVSSVRVNKLSFVDNKLTPIKKITPGREVFHNSTVLDLLSTPTTLFNFDTNTDDDISMSIKIKQPFKKWLPIKPNSSVDKYKWSKTLFILNQNLKLRDDMFLKGHFGTVYKIPENPIKRPRRWIENFISGPRVDNCLFLILQK